MDFIAIILDLAETNTLDYCYHKAEMHRAEVAAALGKVRANIKRNQLLIAVADDRLKSLQGQPKYVNLEYEADKLEYESEYDLLKKQEHGLTEFLSLLDRFINHVNKEVFNENPRLCMSLTCSVLADYSQVQTDADNECKELVWEVFSQDLKSVHKSQLLKLCSKN